MHDAWKRLKQSVAWRVFPWAGLELEVSPHCRLHLRNRGDFIILREIFIDEVYRDFLDRAGPVRSWVDLGCNCGMFSLYLHHHARRSGYSPLPEKGLLIDANAEALAAARDALSAGGLSSGHKLVHGAVAGRGQKEVVFHEGKTTHKSSLSSLGSRGRKCVRPVVDLDKEADWLGGDIDLIKIDIEGAETHVLSDWPDFLRRGKNLIFEWHEPAISGVALDQKLSSLGYAWVCGEAGESREVSLARPVGTGLWGRSG